MLRFLEYYARQYLDDCRLSTSQINCTSNKVLKIPVLHIEKTY